METRPRVRGGRRPAPGDARQTGFRLSGKSHALSSPGGDPDTVPGGESWDRENRYPNGELPSSRIRFGPAPNPPETKLVFRWASMYDLI